MRCARNGTSRIVCLVSAWLSLALPLGAQCRVKLPMKLPDLEAAERRDSNDAAAHYNVGVGYCAAGRYDDAEREFKLATAIEPQFAEPYLALSQLPFARRSRLFDDQYEHSVPEEWVPRLKEADHLYVRAFLIDPFVDVKIIGAVTPHDFGVNAEIGEYYAEYFRDLLDGLDFFSEGKYDRAYTSFQRVYNELNSAAHVDRLANYLLWYHGIAAGHIQKYDDAIWDIQTILNRFEQAEKSDSLIRIPLQTNDYRYILACLKQRAGKLQDAADLFRSALEHDAGLYVAHTRLAQLYESVQRWPVAIAERQAAVNANPDEPSLVYDLGVTLAKGAQWAQADSTLRQAMAVNPRDSRVPYYLGIVEQQLGKKDEARTAFQRFLALAPSRYQVQIDNAKQRLAALQ